MANKEGEGSIPQLLGNIHSKGRLKEQEQSDHHRHQKEWVALIRKSSQIRRRALSTRKLTFRGGRGAISRITLKKFVPGPINPDRDPCVASPLLPLIATAVPLNVRPAEMIETKLLK